MKYGAISVGLILLTFTSIVQATNWTSPDGKLGFDLPTDGSLIEVKNPPAPAIAMWTTADGATRLMFLTQPNTQNVPLDRAGLEEGTVQPGETLLSSKETSLGDVPVFTIAATVHKAFVQQTVIAFSGNVYKVMAGGATPISSDPRLMEVFQSVTILDPAPVPPGKKLSSHDIPFMIGEIGTEIGLAALTVAGIVALIIRASRRKQAKPPPLP